MRCAEVGVRPASSERVIECVARVQEPDHYKQQSCLSGREAVEHETNESVTHLVHALLRIGVAEQGL